MKAMILAAGLGTRLRPLTDNRPKALVTVAGRTLLEITLSRLRSFGVTDVIVNAHHHAGMIVDYLNAHDFGMRIEVSHEHELLDTGGGLRNAAHFFSGSPKEPFILHNVDVLSTIDLGYMVNFHLKQGALATLAVQQRESSRQLLFDESGQLCGRRIVRTAKAESPEIEWARPGLGIQARAFAGIHVLSPLIFTKLEEQGAFSIIDAYLRLTSKGENIVAFRADRYYWRDLGRPEDLFEAAQYMDSGKYGDS